MSVLFFANRVAPRVVEKRLEKIPYKLGPWQGESFSFDKRVIEELSADISVSRKYNYNNRQITLYIGYYGTRKGGRTGHNPNACYPSSGWSINEAKLVPVSDKTSVNRMIVSKNRNSQLVYHWYQAEGNVLKTGIEQNILRFFRRLLSNRDDGAFVRVSIYYSDKSDERSLAKFSNRLIPIIAKLWPLEG